jgi:hypothetical protein
MSETGGRTSAACADSVPSGGPRRRSSPVPCKDKCRPTGINTGMVLCPLAWEEGEEPRTVCVELEWGIGRCWRDP